jgi:hypothetical protein
VAASEQQRGLGGGGVSKVLGRKKMGIEETTVGGWVWSPQINEFLKGRVAAQAASSVIVKEQTVCTTMQSGHGHMEIVF